MLVEQLRKEWRAREASGHFHKMPSFEVYGLVLGAGTVLAKAYRGQRVPSPQDTGARLRALLSAAYCQPITETALTHVKTAILRWSEGDEALAGLHLALARLGQLEQPAEAARRLFMADGLMAAGATPETILRGLGFETAIDKEVLKFPGQGHRPAGQGGGWWMPGHQNGAASAKPQPAHRQPISSHGADTSARAATAMAATGTAVRLTAGLDLGAMGTDAVAAVGAFVTGLFDVGVIATGVTAAGVISAFGVLVIPDTGPQGKWVDVGGLGNVSYFWQPDEIGLHFRYTDTHGVQQTFSAGQDPDGNYRGPDGQVIARWVKTAGKISLVVSTAALVGNSTDEPTLCPVVTPDQPGGSESARDYEDYVKKIINPEDPTPRGFAYKYFNPTTEKFVNIDDCHQLTGFPLEIKGSGFAEHFEKQDAPSKGMISDILKQSLSQVQSTQGLPLTWIFEEKFAADYVRKLFESNGQGRERIKVKWIPWVRK